MLISELADFFQSAPSRMQIIAFKLSDALSQRAHKLLEPNRAGKMAPFSVPRVVKDWLGNRDG